MAEKSLTQLPPDLRRLVTKGDEAAKRDNFDYAIALYSQVLQKQPGCFDVRKALRTVQFGKAGGRTTFFKKVFASASTSPQLAKAQLALRQHPADALPLAEEVLNADPYNSSAHRIVADAAEALEFPQTALLSLELLVKNAPKDKALVTRLGIALADNGQNARAEALLAELQREMPNDPEVAQALKNLSARRTMAEGGYDKVASGEGSYRDILKDKEEAVQLEQEARVVKTEDVASRLIAEYETRLQTEPENHKIMGSLAELYAQQDRFEESLAIYDRLRATDLGKDPSLLRSITDTKVRRLNHEIAQLDPTAPDHAEQVAKLEAGKLEFQLEDSRKRVEQFSTDLGLRFELGTLLFKAGKISEAIQEFQRAQNNPHKRVASMGYLAQCFAQRKMFDLAARTLQNAIKEKPMMDEEKKDLVYQLGTVLDKMGKGEESIEQFKSIYETDIGYRDVAAKVDAYYAEQ